MVQQEQDVEKGKTVIPQSESLPRIIVELQRGGLAHRDEAILYDSRALEMNPFDVMMELSTQKELDALNIAGMIMEANGFQFGQTTHGIDIGVGGGELHGKVVKYLTPLLQRSRVHFILVEPNDAQVSRLRGVRIGLRENTPNYDSTIIHTDWQGFDPELSPVQSFDFGIFSHTLYHIPQEEYYTQFGRIIDVLKDDGRLYFVARTKEDWAYQFMQKYYQRATGIEFTDPTIEDAEGILVQLMGERNLRWKDRVVTPTLRLPFKSNPTMAHKLVEFYLRVPWDELPADVREEIELEYGVKDTTVYQSDKIIELTKQAE